MLKQLGATPNPQNLYFLSLWTMDEATPQLLAQHKNPLAMTDPYKNSAKWETGIWNKVGVVKFDTLEHGGTANAIHLQADDQNSNGYQDIIQALKGNSLLAMWKAVNKSNWCRGCRNGTYPAVPYQALANGGVAPKVDNRVGNTDAAGFPLPPLNSAYVDANGMPTNSATTDGSIGFQGPIGGSQISGSAGDGSKAIICSEKGKALTIGPSFLGTSISQCNVKALTGGMVTILGMQILFLGVVVVGLGLGLKTQTGQTVKRTAVRAGKTAITKKIPKASSATKAARNVSAAPAPPAPPMTATRTTMAA